MWIIRHHPSPWCVCISSSSNALVSLTTEHGQKRKRAREDIHRRSLESKPCSTPQLTVKPRWRPRTRTEPSSSEVAWSWLLLLQGFIPNHLRGAYLAMLCENKLKVPEFLPKLHFLHKKKFLFDFIFSPLSITDRDVAKSAPPPDTAKEHYAIIRLGL